MSAVELRLGKIRARLAQDLIGYGFRDDHINAAILRAAETSPLKMFVVDPMGLDVINWECNGGNIPARSKLYQDFEPYFGGVSRRPLSSTFQPDHLEHAKMMAFLD